MGEVFVAKWQGTIVALKKLFRDDAKSVDEFYKEVKVMRYGRQMCATFIARLRCTTPATLVSDC
jgi:hypothetical protein